MRILILCREDDRSEYDQIDTYKIAIESDARVHSYEYGELESLFFSYDGKELQVLSNGKDISQYDAVFMIGWFKTKILEDIALSAALYARHHGAKVWNSEVLYTRSRSKLSQYVSAAINNVTMTPFMFCKNRELFQQQVQGWTGGYPVIAKGVQASRGNDNYKLHSAAELIETIDLSDPTEGPWFVVQSFVPNDGDYRVIVVGDVVKLVIHRRSSSDESHLNNTSKGGMATIVDTTDLPLETQAQCVRLAKSLRREITGVDIIKHADTGEFFLLEINNMPQLATGSFVAEKMNILDASFGELA